VKKFGKRIKTVPNRGPVDKSSRRVDNHLFKIFLGRTFYDFIRQEMEKKKVGVGVMQIEN
jgi:hypothetical protein